MKNNYFKFILFSAFVILINRDLLAQTTWATILYEDFESYDEGTNLQGIGYAVWSGTMTVEATGANGSLRSAHTDIDNTGITLRRTFNLLAGQTYRFSNDAKFTSTKNHKPLQVISASGVYDYHNPAAFPGTDNWVAYSHEFTVVTGEDEVYIGAYRFPKNVLEIDNLLLEVQAYEWSGAVSNDWNTAGNWAENEVPAATASVVIADVANTPIISGTISIDNIEISDGATVTVNDGGSLEVSGILYANSGYVEVMSGGSLITDGDVYGDAHIIHRQTRFSTGKYSIVGSPVADGAIADLGSIVYSYDETVPYNSLVDNPGSGNDGLDRFVMAAGSLSVGTGYFSAFTDMMTFTGRPNTGDITVPLTYTDHDATGSLDENNFEGFNLVSNPFPSSISYDDFITANESSIESSIWIWDDNSTDLGRGDNGDYVTINAMGAVGTESSIASGLWDGYIRSGQGFFVKASAPGDLLFDDGMRVATNNDDAGFYRHADAYQTLKLKISNKDQSLSNETLIGLSETGLDGIDQLDAQKLAPMGNLKLYTLADSRALAIQSLPLNTTGVQVGFSAANAGTYSVSLAEMANWPSEISVVLIDSELGVQTELSGGGVYHFNTFGEVALNARFRLAFVNKVLAVNAFENDWNIVPTLNGLELKSSDYTGNASISILDVAGRILLTQDISNTNNSMDRIPFQFDKNKIYIIKLSTSEKQTVRKIRF